MCKNLMLTNTAKLSKQDFEKLISTCAKVMTKNDHDGFGYAAYGSNGTFGERYLDVERVSISHNTKQVSSMPKELAGIFLRSESNSFGTSGKLCGGLLIHARFSTNSISIENTHPHCTEKFSLIHNGVVDNIGKTFEFKSTCDSEFLVQHLSDSGIQGMVSNVRGYYAIGAIDNDNGNLIIVKDSRADLFASWVPALDSLVFSTSEEQLAKILKTMRWKHESIDEVLPNIALTFDKTGKLLSQDVIVPTSAISPVSSITESTYNKTLLSDKLDKSSYIRHEYEYREEEYRFEKDILEEERYSITDEYGYEISYLVFCQLTRAEQDKCNCIERASGYPVNLYG